MTGSGGERDPPPVERHPPAATGADGEVEQRDRDERKFEVLRRRAPGRKQTATSPETTRLQRAASRVHLDRITYEPSNSCQLVMIDILSHAGAGVQRDHGPL
ncbi:hypothetical protein GCM10010195_67530 [Kitasatospora griseola]|nr:hypothetical protein GCM10010195_67530 [Kitasatospora griseola]